MIFIINNIEFSHEVSDKEKLLNEELQLKLRRSESRVRPAYFRSISINSSQGSGQLSRKGSNRTLNSFRPDSSRFINSEQSFKFRRKPCVENEPGRKVGPLKSKPLDVNIAHSVPKSVQPPTRAKSASTSNLKSAKTLVRPTSAITPLRPANSKLVRVNSAKIYHASTMPRSSSKPVNVPTNPELENVQSRVRYNRNYQPPRRRKLQENEKENFVTENDKGYEVDTFSLLTREAGS
ncbi:uncharacterized protein LOC111705170 [Eurytemora carolleeae]|uniref:uncharacterized protein LOC111705170 n=1 Tax=Eurytemora carolleeae TaxID=1294199 RepID=UPI000C788FF6|nr:uncharacterized protein LOC111705170 [Eurytemora carolleeae]|eukprot:XP_023333400.1 uncharacterized protein LOC111705170 [Eurytemora affinis]